MSPWVQIPHPPPGQRTGSSEGASQFRGTPSPWSCLTLNHPCAALDHRVWTRRGPDSGGPVMADTCSHLVSCSSRIQGGSRTRPRRRQSSARALPGGGGRTAALALPRVTAFLDRNGSDDEGRDGVSPGPSEGGVGDQAAARNQRKRTPLPNSHAAPLPPVGNSVRRAGNHAKPVDKGTRLREQAGQERVKGRFCGWIVQIMAK